MRVVFLFIAISFVHCQEESEGANERAEKLAEMMRHDGVERVGELSQKNIKGLLKKYNVMVVLFHTHSNETTLRQDKYALEVVTIFICLLFNRYVYTLIAPGCYCLEGAAAFEGTSMLLIRWH